MKARLITEEDILKKKLVYDLQEQKVVCEMRCAPACSHHES